VYSRCNKTYLTELFIINQSFSFKNFILNYTNVGNARGVWTLYIHIIHTYIPIFVIQVIWFAGCTTVYGIIYLRDRCRWTKLLLSTVCCQLTLSKQLLNYSSLAVCGQIEFHVRISLFVVRREYYYFWK